MQNREKNIDQVFRDGLQNYQVIPPKGVWEGVKSSIPTTRAPFPWAKIAATVLVLILAGTSWLIMNRERASDALDQDKLVQGTTKEVSPQQSKTGNSSIDKTQALLSTHVGSKEASVQGSKGEKKVDQPVNPDEENIVRLNAGTTHLAFLPKKVSSVTSLGNQPIEATLISRPSKKANYVPKLDPLLLNQFIAQNDLDLSAQGHWSEGTKKAKWGLSGNLSPVFSFRTISSNNSSKQEMAFFYSRESSMFSYSGGVTATYKKGRRLSFQTGMQYLKGGQILNDLIFYRNLVTGALLKRDIYNQNIPYPFETSVGQVASANLNPLMADFIFPDGSKYTSNLSAQPQFDNYESITTNVDQEFGFIEFPMLLRYRILDRKIGLDVISGLGTTILIDNNAYIQYGDQKISLGKSQGVSPLNFTGNLGLGFNYALGSKFSLNFEPTFKYFINSFNTSSNLDVHPYFFGIYSGLSYFF